MMETGRLTSAINQNTPEGAYATYRTTAVTQSGLDIPDPYSETALLDGICKKETTTPTHCYALHDPLYWNSVKIGEKSVGQGEARHTYTDAGLGWGSVQPYNRGARNLYDPQGNMTRVAEMVKGHLPSADAVPGKKSRIWHAVFGYHRGHTHPTMTPTQLRVADDPKDVEAAGYADDVFGKIGAPFTPVPTTNNDN